MKKILPLLALLIIASSFVTISFNQIVNALKDGDSNAMARYFDKTVEIALPLKSCSYSRSQGELVLEDFFNNNPVKGFDIIHKGDNGYSQYCIGNLNTSNGAYRTTIFIRQKGDKQLVQELRFEK